MVKGGSKKENERQRRLVAKLRRVLQRLKADLRKEFRRDHLESVVNQIQMHRRVFNLYFEAFKECFPTSNLSGRLFENWEDVIMTPIYDTLPAMTKMIKRLKHAAKALDNGLERLHDDLRKTSGATVADKKLSQRE